MVGYRVALVGDNESQTTKSERVLAATLAESFEVTTVSWQNKQVQWADYDAVVLRTCWNYYNHINDFLDWLSESEATGVRLMNSAQVVRWNAYKNYLFDLKAKDVPVIDTVLVPRDVQHQHDPARFQAGSVIVKPCYGADSYEVQRISNHAVSQVNQAVQGMQTTSDVLIQPYLLEAREELSFIFIGGQYSHAVKKQSRHDDFVRSGLETLYQPPSSVVSEAAHMVQLVDEPLLYARVDAVVVGGVLTLMELELIEPFLYFDIYPVAAVRFREALGKKLANNARLQSRRDASIRI